MIFYVKRECFAESLRNYKINGFEISELGKK